MAHGEANYALLTSVLKKYSMKECSDNYQETMGVLKSALGCEAGEITAKLNHLLNVVLEKQPMSHYGTTSKDIPAFADSVLKYISAPLQSYGAFLYHRSVRRTFL